ncbi:MULTISPECIES: NepR family anti-sigma factor [Inquilinus]|uniref:Anti-sigma factor NepR domain-containing protein n=1 Tax=Inquilinus ginsengisoli TaxID=363840 RepID=A0ABU1K0Z5_9PROT|nr:NepR family anti-sigma factor [Inquilinus ginsengisoli]MDR6294553.1 hypothetical protein [Inquilinus ginsengisoli]
MRKREAGAPRPAEPGRVAPDRLKKPPQFDNWLSQQLKSLYDPVLDEPLPDDLLEMLEQGAKKPKPEEDKDR